MSTIQNRPKHSLLLYSIVPQTRALGPGLRFAVWVQGCPMRCPGCMTPGSLEKAGGIAVSTERLAERIIATPGIEGLTLSGGEPFMQADALSSLVDQVRRAKNLGIIVYTGFTLRKLHQLCAENQTMDTFFQCIDLLVDGPYVAAQNDGRSLRGSSNQRIHDLSGRYQAVIDTFYEQPQRAVEVHLRQEDLMLVGIPGKESLLHWQARFASNLTTPLSTTT